MWLIDTSKNLLSTRDMDQLVVLIANSFQTLTGATDSTVFLRDRKSAELICRFDGTKSAANLPAPRWLVMSDLERLNHRLKTAPNNESSIQDKRCIYRDGRSGMAPITVDSEVLGMVCMRFSNHGDNLPCDSFTLLSLVELTAAAVENAKLYHHASNDPLTGLPNSSFFVLELAKVFKESKPDWEGGIILLDLDSFKRINESGGAGGGDQALIDIGATLQDVLRTDGLVARYGSDKFGILLAPENEFPMHLRLRDVAERARAAISAKTFHEISLSACLGGIMFNSNSAESPAELIAMADDALGLARSRGRGEVEIHT